MTRWYRLEPVDLGIFDTAGQVYRFPVRVPVSTERVWESLVSDQSVAAWGPAVRRLTWTSPRPFGIGTTREVVLPLGSITVRERFFRWDEGTGYSFCVTEANRPGLRACAENYVVEPDGTGTLLTWTVAIDPKLRLAPALKVVAPVTKTAFGQLVAGTRRYFAGG